MFKSFSYWFRLATVTSLCGLLTVNPAYAGRFFRSFGNYDRCGGNSCYSPCYTWCEPCYVDCCSPCWSDCMVVPNCQNSFCPSAPCGTAVIVVPANPSCGCESGPIVVSPFSNQTTPGMGMPSANPTSPNPPLELAPKASDSNPPAVQPIPDNNVIPGNPLQQPEPPAGQEPGNEPNLSEPTKDVVPSLDEPSMENTEPAPAKDNSDFGNLFDDKPAENTEPAQEMQPTEQPTEQPGDNLFDNAPVTEDKQDPPAGDGLFDASNEPVKEDNNLFGEPKVEPAKEAGDLFDNAPAPANDEGSLFDQGEMQGNENEEPKEEKGDAAPNANELDSLFGNPTEEPKKEESKDDTGSLFDQAPPESAPAPSADDDLFGSGDSSNRTGDVSSNAEESFGRIGTPSTPQDGSDLEGLFDKGTEESSKKSDADKPSDNINDLFGEVDHNPTFHGAEFRDWKDNTGRFSVDARLVTIFPDKVRLLKSNGKHTTVPFRRLSNNDKLYVQWVIAKLNPSQELKFVSTSVNSESR